MKRHAKQSRHSYLSISLIACFAFVCSFVFSYYAPGLFTITYESVTAGPVMGKELSVIPEKKKVTHITTPDSVRAIYMTSWVAGTPHLREKLINLIDTTEINAVVIDIKDYSGKIAFEVKDTELQKIGSFENRISDIDEFIEQLHQKNIYVIGRISSFQDAYMVKKAPEYAVKKASDKNVVWADYKGISWIDAGATPAWEYLTRIGFESYERGFDELNFDYIRFPSDGNMKDIYYPWSGTSTKSAVLESFFSHLHKTFAPHNIPISADLFGMVTTNTDDLNIGQVLEKALPYFDFVAPMVYPSHYPRGWNGFSDPEEKPYEVIQISMKSAVDRAIAQGINPRKLRPWLQDFALRVPRYGAKEVRAQIQATYDVGLNSWMLWDASNKYQSGGILVGDTLPPISISGTTSPFISNMSASSHGSSSTDVSSVGQ